MSMMWIGIAGTAVAVGGQVMNAQSAKKQAKGLEQQAANRLRLFGERQPGLASMEGLAELAEFDINVNPEDFMEAGGNMTRWAMGLMREEAELTFNQTVGPQNLGAFNSFLSDNLERANFDFESLPPEIMRTLEGSALSRAIGGPAGMAENLSVQNKIMLQQQGEQSAFRALAFRQGFMPDLLNPIDTTMDLANFERQNQVSEAGIQMQALGGLADLEMSRFQLEQGYQPPNTAGISEAANAQVLNTLGQGLMTAGTAYATTRTPQSYGAQGGQPQYAYAPVQQQTAPAETWRQNATSFNNIYYRG